MATQVPLHLGEKVMPQAPMVQLNNGEYCVPQHYLTYEHTLESVEALICDIDYDPRYVVFAAEQESGIYIQVGVVGHDNYNNSLQGSKLKLLFGRKWRVEPELSTSEIIQTVFLAIKKSREHEIRELFKLSVNNTVTTPFNTHIDLPLMARFYEPQQQHKTSRNEITPQKQIDTVLSCIDYDGCQLTTTAVQQRPNHLWLVDIAVHCSELSSLPEIEQQTLYLQLQDLSLNTLCRAVMQEFIRLSDLHVDQHFSYKGFFRFDPDIDIAEIASLSQQSRKHELAAHFASEFTKSNKQVDDMRIPPVQAGALAEKHEAIIKQFQLHKTAF
ncbi:hypothetical protein GCM10007916_02560 [Psychromonas marina]|uniref:Uncharacterized protein n=1 Tax=Psychromonas marina TaxID=88364 RepID=A0ABQ6DVS5_9GAMM|nr:hypothetical protein [Psychromonas marina]GLS89189.1 hypothetical protein GCM10007916_02560 [Psychromonas marina]